MTNLDFSVFSWQLMKGFVSSGLIFSVQLTLIAMAGGILIGTLLALMRLSGSKLLEIPARIYVDGLRSIPLVMVILWVYLLIPLFLGRPIGKELSAMVTFTIFEAAYYSEIMRAGIQSISRGQVFAGQAMGLTLPQTYRYVILPMAYRIILPPLTSEAMNIIKNSSVAFAVSISELILFAMQAQEETSRGIEIYLGVTGLYIVSAFAVNRLMAFIETRVRVPGYVGGGK